MSSHRLSSASCGLLAVSSARDRLIHRLTFDGGSGRPAPVTRYGRPSGRRYDSSGRFRDRCRVGRPVVLTARRHSTLQRPAAVRLASRLCRDHSYRPRAFAASHYTTEQQQQQGRWRMTAGVGGGPEQISPPDSPVRGSELSWAVLRHAISFRSTSPPPAAQLYRQLSRGDHGKLP